MPAGKIFKGFERSRTLDQEEGVKKLLIFGNSACFESKIDRIVCERCCSIGQKKNADEVKKELFPVRVRHRLVRYTVRKHFRVKTTDLIAEVIERIRRPQDVDSWVGCERLKLYQENSIVPSRRRWH